MESHRGPQRATEKLAKIMNEKDFKELVIEGIPSELPDLKEYDQKINHAPKRKDILDITEKRLAVKNALRYFPVKFHEVLSKEFASELKDLWQDLYVQIQTRL